MKIGIFLYNSFLKKNKATKQNGALAILVACLFYCGACQKESVNNAVIKGSIYHHAWQVSGVKVYLKKDCTEFPGYQTNLYDDSTLAISNTRFEAPFTFHGLSAGDYYVYVYGFDTLFNMPVRGAHFYHISDNLQILNEDIQVSE